MKKRYYVKGMHCAACSAAVERALKKLEGIEQAEVNLLANTAYIEGKQLPSDDIIKEKITKIGFELVDVPAHTYTYEVEGMHCAACSAAVERVLKKQDSILHVEVNLLMNKAMIQAYEEHYEKWAQVVEKAGFVLRAKQIIHQCYFEIDDDTHLETILKHPGIVKWEVKDHLLSVDYHPNQLKRMDIYDLLKAHKNVTLLTHHQEEQKEEKSSVKQQIIFTLVLAFILLYIGMSHMLGPITLPLPSIIHYDVHPFHFALIQFILTTIILVIGRGFYIRGLKALKNKSPNMDTLVAIGTGSAYIYSLVSMIRILMGDVHAVHELYFEGAGVVVALVQFGKHLEAISKAKSAGAISALLQLRPQEAILYRQQEEVVVSIDEICVGDVLVVKAGDHIPVDGIVVEGSSHVDESMLSGESMPVDKQIGSKVSQGTMNIDGRLLVSCGCELEETTLSKIISMVEDAQAKKAPIARIADKVSGIFVPAVMSIAFIAGLIWWFVTHDIAFALSIFVAVMVIACPCSLGLATPTAIMVGSGKAAQLGIFVKSGEALETSAHIDTIVFDKTGTITIGKPVVEQVITKYDQKDMLAYAAGLEAGSKHPLAKAILDASHTSYSFQNVTTENGYGVYGMYEQQKYSIGSKAYMLKQNFDMHIWSQEAKKYLSQGKNVIFLANEQEVVAMFVICDALKENVSQVMDQLKQMGINVYLLSGDHPLSVHSIAKEAHIDHVFAQVLPHEKKEKIEALQQAGHKVAMVGDGINDAIALSQADVGIAIGSGSDVAIESADVVLMKDDVKDVQTTIQLSRAVIKNIHQNLFWAFFYNTIGIPIAAGILYPIWGILLSPVFAGAAMAFSSVSVVSNALRLRKFKP